jgi:hypothetical protein
MEAERERCVLGGVLALISGNQLRLMAGQERLCGLLRATLGGLTVKNALARGRFSPEAWHFGASGEYELIQAAGTLLSQLQSWNGLSKGNSD